MNKLLGLKEWLTLSECTNHLSSLMGEVVTEADIYKLFLDGHLQLSINFINWAEGQFCQTVELSEEDFTKTNIDKKSLLKTVKLSNGQYATFNERVEDVNGVWDFLMLEAEKDQIEKRYYELISNTNMKNQNFKGMFFRQGDKLFRLLSHIETDPKEFGSKAEEKKIESDIKDKCIPQERADALREVYKAKRRHFIQKITSNEKIDNYHIAKEIPEDAVLVVKTSAILELLDNINGKSTKIEKELSTKEKTTLLVMIGALCKHAKIAYNVRGVSNAFVKMTEELGAPLSEDTVRKILSEIDDAVASRSK